MSPVSNEIASSSVSDFRFNKYLPIAILYFFFNGFLLPHGLLYTAILTPFFILWLYTRPSFNYIWLFFLVSIPYVIIHFANGVEPLTYLKSYLLLFSVFVFALSFYQFLKNCNTLPYLFKAIILINSFFLIVALIARFIPMLESAFWHISEITSGVKATKRLKMLTYEASYYSFLLVPIALYYYLKMIFLSLPNKWLVFWLITIPLLLSLSFGVILTLIMTLVLLFCSDINLLKVNKKYPAYIITGLFFLVILLFVALHFFPDNIIFIRVANVFKGRDTSFSGRTFDSLYLGWQLASQKSIFFGCGPGQIKIIGGDLFKDYYNYSLFTPDQIAVPNSLGDTLATFGISGVIIKLGLEIYFFFKTRVYNNLYRLGIFLFIFIYQFTGSFLTNIAEYVLWIMAFSPLLFAEFEKSNIYERPRYGV